MSNPGAPQQPGVAPGQPVHLYEAVSTERERAVTGFDAQREAILKAVDDQRLAAMAPIRAMQMRQAQSGAHPAQQNTGIAMNPPTQPPPSRQQAVAADIVLTLKAMVAEEVRVQLIALLAAADARQKANAAPPAAAPQTVTLGHLG